MNEGNARTCAKSPSPYPGTCTKSPGPMYPPGLVLSLPAPGTCSKSPGHIFAYVGLHDKMTHKNTCSAHNSQNHAASTAEGSQMLFKRIVSG